MTTLSILLIGIIFGGLVVWIFWGNSSDGEEEHDRCVRKMESKDEENESGGIKSINEERTKQKEERKERILKFVQEKGRVENKDVENLLGVSDATATRYLNELENDGKIRQIGDTGSGVYYEPNGSHAD